MFVRDMLFLFVFDFSCLALLYNKHIFLGYNLFWVPYTCCHALSRETVVSKYNRDCDHSVKLLQLMWTRSLACSGLYSTCQGVADVDNTDLFHRLHFHLFVTIAVTVHQCHSEHQTWQLLLRWCIHVTNSIQFHLLVLSLLQMISTGLTNLVS